MPSERARLIALLDQMQAADVAGAAALAQWVANCADPRLRGGLRVIQARDACHATQVGARLAMLGATPQATASRNLTSLLQVLAATGVGDRSKLAILTARFPARADDPFTALLGDIAGDDETRALLETIADDDRVSLQWLREMSGTPPVASVHADRAEREQAASGLDALAVAEAASAVVLDAWAARCRLPGLRGGLRALAAREATHARLCAERRAALGGEARARLPLACREAATSFFGGDGSSDDEKLRAVLARYPDDGDAAAPVAAMAEGLTGDLETRELLRLVAGAEAATLAWLRAQHATLGRAATRAAEHPANG